MAAIPWYGRLPDDMKAKFDSWLPNVRGNIDVDQAAEAFHAGWQYGYEKAYKVATKPPTKD